MEEIKTSGLYKTERIISSPQGAEITVNGKMVLNFCANNYLGLILTSKVIEAAHKAIDSHGYGMSSVRFICGTQDIHKELEEKISAIPGHRGYDIYMLLLLMQMVVYLNLCSMKKMRSFLMH